MAITRFYTSWKNFRLWFAIVCAFVFINEMIVQRQQMTNFTSYLTSIKSYGEPETINNCADPMIVLVDIGRMGNQFFEYMQAKVITEQANRTFYISRPLYQLFRKYFNGPKTPIYETELLNECQGKFKNWSINFAASLKNPEEPYIQLLPGWPALIPSWFWTTMLQRRSELLSEFQWRPELKRDVHEYIEQITANHVYSTLVGVHVRMQDYHSHLTRFNKNVTLPGVKYFNQSMNYYKKKYGNPLFLVVSNDMDWCKENVQGANVVYAGKGIEDDPGWDLALLTSCDHLIITYGSYGVMAAYLIAGRGEVVAADNFTSNEESFTKNIRGANWPNWHWVGPISPNIGPKPTSIRPDSTYIGSNSTNIRPNSIKSYGEPKTINNCANPMIVLVDIGRMGNQFFEYMQAKVITEHANRTFYISRPLYELFRKYFNGPQTPVYEPELLIECQGKFKNWSINYAAALKNPKEPYIQLLPGWPSLIPSWFWTSMLQRQSELLSEFQWRPELKRDVHEYIAQITANHVYSTLVGVHVRMQDYFKHLASFNKNVKLPGAKYFNQSMNYYNTKYGNPLFLVVSNDMDWCKENVQGANVVYAGKGNETDPGWDLALLTSCDHLIITYGSYGVMAAYLMAGRGEVVAAKNFTSNVESFTKNMRGAKWPNWHRVDV